MEENKTQEPMVPKSEVKEVKKSNNKLVIALLVIIVAMGCYIAYSEYQKANKKDEPKTEQKEEKKEEVVEKDIELTDELKSTIIEKMSILFSVKKADIKDNKLLAQGALFQNIWSGILTNSATDSDKTNIILSRFGEEKSYIEYEKHKFNDSKLPTTLKNYDDGDHTFDTVDGELFTKQYKAVFNEDPSYKDPEFICPAYYYDYTAQKYIVIIACGGGTSIGPMVYMDSFETTKDSVIVNAYVGLYVYDGGKAYTYNDATAKNVTTARKTTELFKDQVSINESNKTKFTKYKFIFTKAEDGNFYFTKTEKAS
jgi:hypothetical protein